MIGLYITLRGNNAIITPVSSTGEEMMAEAYREDKLDGRSKAGSYFTSAPRAAEFASRIEAADQRVEYS